MYIGVLIKSPGPVIATRSIRHPIYKLVIIHKHNSIYCLEAQPRNLFMPWGFMTKYRDLYTGPLREILSESLHLFKRLGLPTH